MILVFFWGEIHETALKKLDFEHHQFVERSRMARPSSICLKQTSPYFSSFSSTPIVKPVSRFAE